MKTYTVKENKTGKTFEVNGYGDGGMLHAIHKKTRELDLTITDNETGETRQMAEEILSDSAYIWAERRMGKVVQYLLFVRIGEDDGMPAYGAIINVEPDRTEGNTHRIGRWYVNFPKSDVKGVKYAFIDACEKNGHLLFIDLETECFKQINSNAIVADDRTMMEKGLIGKCTPRDGHITLWTYEKNDVWHKMQWTPVMRVFTEPLKENLMDEYGNVTDRPSTHKIDDFYGTPIDSKLDLTRFLNKRGIATEKL